MNIRSVGRLEVAISMLMVGRGTIRLVVRHRYLRSLFVVALRSAGCRVAHSHATTSWDAIRVMVSQSLDREVLVNMGGEQAAQRMRQQRRLQRPR